MDLTPGDRARFDQELAAWQEKVVYCAQVMNSAPSNKTAADKYALMADTFTELLQAENRDKALAAAILLLATHLTEDEDSYSALAHLEDDVTDDGGDPWW